MVNLSGKMRAKDSGDEVFFHIEVPDRDLAEREATEAVSALRVAMQEFHDLKNIEVSTT